MSARRLLVATAFPLSLLLLLLCLLPAPSNAFYNDGELESYAKYRKWHACLNGSISFEFKGNDPDGLLFYTDDGGQYDFFELRLEKGRILFRYNFDTGTDTGTGAGSGTVARIYLEEVPNLNDNRWHKVFIQRDEVSTILKIDEYEKISRIPGLDFQFGDFKTNNHVFLGGMPKFYRNPDNLRLLALPSIMFGKRWRGQFRNLKYSDCACPPRTADILQMEGARKDNPCELSNPCLIRNDSNCDCFINDKNEQDCDCSDKRCGEEIVIKYVIPYDEIEIKNENQNMNRYVKNPTQLNARVYGRGQLMKGVVRQAMDFDGIKDRVTIEAARKDKACFGNLKYCRDSGFTMGFWLFPRGHHHRRVHILSSGGYGGRRPGVAVYYEKGKLYAVVTTDDEKQYTASAPIFLNSLYHVAFSWNKKDGIKLYLNGNLQDSAMSIRAKEVMVKEQDLHQLVVGVSSQDEKFTEMKDASFVMDEFNFWTSALTEKKIKEAIGPIVRMQLSFDQKNSGNIYAGNHLTAEAMGNPPPSQFQGRVKQAIKLEGGSNQHLRITEADYPCLVDFDNCPHGMTLSFWAQFGDVQDGMYFLSSKNLQLFAEGDRLVAQITANVGEGENKELRKWVVKSNKPIAEHRWPPPSPYQPRPYMSIRYFVEISWDPDTDEMHLYLNDVDRATTSTPAPAGSLPDVEGEFLIGKAIDTIPDAKYADMIIDELDVWTADRQTLLLYNFIQRGIINHHIFYLDDVKELMSNGLIGTKNGAITRVEGKIDHAIFLNGKEQFVEFGNGEVTNWVGNMDAAPHGQLVAFWIRPKVGLKENSVIYENNGVRIYVDDQKNIRAKFRSWQKEWDVEVPGLKSGEWNFVEFDIDPTGIIHYHLNSHAEDKTAESVAKDNIYEKPDNYKFYLGRPIDDNAGYSNLNAEIDNLEIYEGRRSWLVAHGHIVRGKPERFEIGMNKQEYEDFHGYFISDVSPFFDVTTHNVQLKEGLDGNAAHLDGQNSYIDLGDHTDVCFGDLSRCRHGITMSHYFRINDFSEDKYLLSSPGLNVFTKGGKLYVKVNAEGKTWELPVENIDEGKWYNLLYTWRKDKGLSIFTKEGSGLTKEDYKSPQATLVEGKDEVIVQGFQNAIIGKHADAKGVDGANTAKLDHDLLIQNSVHLQELIAVYPGGLDGPVPVPDGGGGGARITEAGFVPGLDIFSAGFGVGEILGIISGVLLTLTSCALAAYYSGNAPCVTGMAAKKEGLGIGGPNQIIITGKEKDDQLTQQLLDVSATNGAIISSQTTRNVENINVYNETNVNVSNIKKTHIKNIEEQELIQSTQQGMGAGVGAGLGAALLVTSADGADANSQTNQSAYREENFQQESFNYQEANSTAIAVTTEEENYNFRSSGRYSIYNEGTEIAENSQIVSVIITPDDKYVIAGSRHWPPQVWDIDTGEIVHSMQSDTEGCSNLHLASGGRLLVGLVDILDAYESGGSTEGSAPEADRQLFQRLEVWNFRTGDPLTMSQAEMCSKVILTKDRNSAIFARCDRYGNELSVVVWDLIQMRAMREVKCRSSNLFCDNVDFLALSPNQDCAIAGYTNTKNGEATYVTFFLEKDINRTAEPKMVYMDANVECTTILNNNEAVTGTKSGELKLWNYRTGRTLRQLSGFTASKPNNDSFVAHQRAVTCLMLSENSRYLVSGSADATVKVWNMDSERLLTTLKGHEDEVWCSAISPDNEFIVTGSKDKTIRLWRLATGGLVCTFNTMVDIFQVFITSDKKTIVALGDREGSRILIMLKVVMQSTTVVRTRTENDAIEYD